MQHSETVVIKINYLNKVTPSKMLSNDLGKILLPTFSVNENFLNLLDTKKATLVKITLTTLRDFFCCTGV
jgi:hypothetical protein